MQLLDSSVARLLDDLQDIVNNVQIKSNFCISHPNYKPMGFRLRVLTRFQPLPLDIRNKYLSLQLRKFLYGIYYNGALRATLAPDANSDNLPVYQHLQNNTVVGINLEFYAQLHESNGGEGYFDPGWSC
jgi:hypothetical protein